MGTKHASGPHVLRASVLAGPFIVGLWLFAFMATNVPHVIAANWQMIAPGVLILVLSAIIGLLPALVACTLGAGLLVAASRTQEWARAGECWVAAGAILAAAPCLYFAADPTLTFAMAGSGAICAFMVHRSVASSL